jgi:hypothetical protein
MRIYRSGAITLLLFLALVAVVDESAARAAFELHDHVKVGARPVYGMVLGEYRAEYSHAPGFFLYAQGGYRLKVGNELMIYPGVSWGFLYCAHGSESGRRLMMFPFSLDLFFDAPLLNFNTKAGIFALVPSIGVGVYLNDYRSGRTSATGGDFGYRIGVNLEYRHAKMRNAYVDLRIDHLGTTNFRDYLPVLAFGVGAGYMFPIRGPKGPGKGRAANTRGSVEL